ncbi:Zona pellucida-like domain-containing protein 1 [Collichthys lucidus]|uniref:Zona pellucida-like domain-containing protein 1 n=1 Tax=Collichthys lucidus TaxID=240159 RepID=A0A4U5UZK2_COLLU|nr:Zona pellucida-like domain-containing protein 1 [Collichthys lucidus]
MKMKKSAFGQHHASSAWRVEYFSLAHGKKAKEVATDETPVNNSQIASGDRSQPMNPVTSALISGVVILGGVSVCFFLLSLHLLQRSRLPSTTASGVWNPSFK